MHFTAFKFRKRLFVNMRYAQGSIASSKDANVFVDISDNRKKPEHCFSRLLFLVPAPVDFILILSLILRLWIALGDRYRNFYRTLNNAKKTIHSIFNSKKFQPYSFKILFI